MFDVIVGANGQDGTLLSKIYARHKKKVILIGRQPPPILLENQHYITQDLREYRKLDEKISNFKIRTVIYLAATHSTRNKFEELDAQNVRLINFDAPKWLLQYLIRNRNIKSFVYTSSKLAFEGNGGSYSWQSKRKNDNEYSRSKNDFEQFAKTISDKLNWLLIIWMSNHESKYRKEEFLIPRVVKKLSECLIDEKNIFHEKYNVVNDWGDAEEFMEILYEFVQENKKKGIIKQFLSNNDLCSIDEIINEILFYKSKYGDFLDNQRAADKNNIFISEREYLRKPIKSTRATIWRLLNEYTEI